MIKVASLGSGSKGNATLIRTPTTTLMVDCGFSLRETEKRLRRIQIEPHCVSGILVTHEHSDHLKGVAVFANKYDIPVWLSCGTAAHKLAENIRHPVLINRFLSSIWLGDIEVTPVPVPHDAAEACQFIFSFDCRKIGLLTDLGHISALVLEEYSAVDMLLLEFNYDQSMLEQGPYPWHLKQRVGGPYGHLSNDQAIDMLKRLKKNQLKKLIAMHISEKNNSRKLVQELLKQALDSHKTQFDIACQKEGFDWISF